MKQLFLRTLVVVCLLAAAIPAVTAFTATLVEPATPATVLHNGDRITFNVNDLADNDYIDFYASTWNTEPSGTSYTFSSLDMPFRLEPPGSTFIMGLDTYRITNPSLVISKQGDGSISYTGSNSYLRYTPIPKGVYDISVSGTPSDQTIGLVLLIQGMARAPIPEPSTITFTIQGVNSGYLYIRVGGEGGKALMETFTIEP